MIIDFHTHCFPPAISEKAMEILRFRSGILEPWHSGSSESLAAKAKDNGVDFSVVLNIATNAHQQKKVNDFAISLKNIPGIIPFGSVHPESPDALDELERLKENGIKGVKLHPDYQDFFIDEDRMIPIYEKIGKLGFITVLHTGIDMGYPRPVHCPAEKLASVLEAFGDAPVVAAHFGGLCDWDNVEKHLIGKNIYFDTAYCYGLFPPKLAKELIDLHGADKVLFGSDTPWSSPKQTVNLIKCFGLSEENEKAVLGENARKLLEI